MLSEMSPDNVVKRKIIASRLERQEIVLWRRPIQTVEYCFREIYCQGCDIFRQLFRYRRELLNFALAGVVLYLICISPGPHAKLVARLDTFIHLIVYWFILGILSSIGVGTGLHTFILYLAPHIASVTLAAFQCNSLDFPEPPYPEKIICPDSKIIRSASSKSANSTISMIEILNKVEVETVFWGAGSAVGELPPYFMARTARLYDDEKDIEIETLDDMIKSLSFREDEDRVVSWWDRIRVAIEDFVVALGFLSILFMASVPNPFFDLVGFACGHCLVPFQIFFGATFIGKAFIKANLQAFFVIFTCSESEAKNQLVNLLTSVPVMGSIFEDFFKNRKRQLRFNDNSTHIGGENRTSAIFAASNPNIVGTLFECLVGFMVVAFVVSVVNTLAQEYHHRLCNIELREITKIKLQ